jgi:D-aminoacyl-tRNA deacylase
MLWKPYRYYVTVLQAVTVSFLLFYSTTDSRSNRRPSIFITVNAMRVVIQRVKSASVMTTENNVVVAQIGHGLVALVGIHVDDTLSDAQYCCQHILNCKLWNNDETNKPWKLSVKQKQYDCLLVSQFTLYGTVNKKSSYIPDYKLAMKSIAAKSLYDELIQMITIQYGTDTNKIHSGIFGTMMDVSLINDGPVTIIIDSRTSTTTNSITPNTASATFTNDNSNNNTDEAIS